MERLRLMATDVRYLVYKPDREADKTLITAITRSQGQEDAINGIPFMVFALQGS